MSGIGEVLGGGQDFYILQTDWLLNWFPKRSIPGGLDGVRMRGGTFRHRSSDFMASDGTVFAAQVHSIGEGGADGDPIAFGGLVRGHITVGIDSDSLFAIEVKLVIGTLERTKRFGMDRNLRTPILFNLEFDGDEVIIASTVVSFQGVFITSGTFSSAIITPAEL